jgi:ATP-dependent Clp protease ATP-binding subunit ClpB
VVFDPLERDQLREIVDIQVQMLSERLARRSLVLELTDAAREHLATAGYDPTFGARPLKRLIQRELQDPLAMRMLSGEVVDGDRVVVDAGDDGLSFRVEHVEAEPDATATSSR